MNYIKLIGMVLLFFSASGVGLSAAAAVRRSQRQLGQLKLSLEMMRCEISYALTPADRLFALLSRSSIGEIASFYGKLAEKLEAGAENVFKAASAAKSECTRLCLPEETQQSLDELFASFGAFDAEGQLRLIDLTQEKITSQLEELSAQKKYRCRCYETLGICTGLALVILVL